MTPEFLYLKGPPPTKNDLRHLLREMVEKGATEETKNYVAATCRMKPTERLWRSVALGAHLMSKSIVREAEVMVRDGLTDDEQRVLVDLDWRVYSRRSRETIRKLMCIKERWMLNKHLRGYFVRAQTDDGYLSMEGDNDHGE